MGQGDRDSNRTWGHRRCLTQGANPQVPNHHTGWVQEWASEGMVQANKGVGVMYIIPKANPLPPCHLTGLLATLDNTATCE